ncbi:MAG: Asp/Glu racemase [Proteobacteria bacterium]|nr:Asp/Glu racemase [Pseudomonadota bacterium]
MRRVACLHTADSNIAIFDAAAEGLDLTLRHVVRSDLLTATERTGGLTPDIVAATEIALRQASDGADIVLLGCSTLGPVADRLRLPVPVRRIDRALAEAARDAAAGGRVAVLYAFAGTRNATEALFREVAGAAIDMQLVDGAWDAFKSGDHAAYLALIAAAADSAAEKGAASVALAQASMAPATALCHRAKPLSSPHVSLAAAAR